jgi:RNA polymerase sigma factor FliA
VDVYVNYLRRKLDDGYGRHLIHTTRGVGYELISGLEVGSLRVESPLDCREQDLCEYLPEDSEEAPLFLCLRSEMAHLLARAIADLPEREREVLVLYYYEELTMKEAGIILGLGESQVSQIHSMAVIRLRARLAETEQQTPRPRDCAGAAGGRAMKGSTEENRLSSCWPRLFPRF